MSDFQHFVITRFNVAQPGGAHCDPVWLAKRCQLFEQFCLPSVAAQSIQAFHWLVLIDPDTPGWVLDRLAACGKRRAIVQAPATPVGPDEITAIQSLIRRQLSPGVSHVITTRLDSDDAIATNYVARIQAEFTGQHREFLNFRHGYLWHEGRVSTTGQESNPFVSLVERTDGLLCVYCRPHRLLYQVGAVRQLDGPPMWMQVIHDCNKHSRLSMFGQREWVPDASIRKRFPAPGAPSDATPRIGADMPDFKLREDSPQVVVVDDFYDDPQAVREFALTHEFVAHPKYHKGQRTEKRFLFPGLEEAFSRYIQHPITQWTQHGVNGVFQICGCRDPLVYHSDSQQWAGAIYLTPDAPPETGTSLYRSKATKLRKQPTTADAKRAGMSMAKLSRDTYAGNILDRTKWELVDSIGNVFNRLVLWRGDLVHSASQYFGNNREDSRLIHLFFFDIE